MNSKTKRRLKSGPKRKRGRPEVVSGRIAARRRQAERRERLRGYGLRAVEIWLLPDELQPLREDALLRILEMDYWTALQSGDPQDALSKRIAVEAQREKMGLDHAAPDMLMAEVSERQVVRTLDAGSKPEPLMRLSTAVLGGPSLEASKPHSFKELLNQIKPSWQI